MDNVLIVVDDLEAVKAFFIALGLTLEGQPHWAGQRASHPRDAAHPRRTGH
jgi:hypothetical protein